MDITCGNCPCWVNKSENAPGVLPVIGAPVPGECRAIPPNALQGVASGKGIIFIGSGYPPVSSHFPACFMHPLKQAVLIEAINKLAAQAAETANEHRA